MILVSVITAKNRSKTTICANHLKQLGLVFHLYAADNNGWLPHLTHNQWGCPFLGEWFMFYTTYLPTGPLPRGPRNIYELGRPRRVFDCPATTKAVGFIVGPDAPLSSQVTEKPFDYMIGYEGGNSACQAPLEGLNGKKLMDLARGVILLIDHQADRSWYGQVSPIEGLVWNCYYFGGTAPDAYLYVPGFHHDNGANILFSDGRVEWHARRDYQPGWQTGNLAMVTEMNN